MNVPKSIEIKNKRINAISLLLKQSESWNDKLYTVYDFQIDLILRDCLKIESRTLGKEPFDFIEL